MGSARPLVLVFLLGALLGGPAPASTAGNFGADDSPRLGARMDAWGRWTNHPWMGDDMILPESQTVFGRVRRGTTTRFYFRVESDGSQAGDAVITGCRSYTRVRITYRHAGTDISRRVRAGTYRTPNLEPGETHTIALFARALTDAALGFRSCTVTFGSDSIEFRINVLRPR